MNRPEFLRSTTVYDTRKEVKRNLEALEHVGWMMANGFVFGPDGIDETNERWINSTMTEFVIQQEYLRERENANWGWDKNIVDFSKTATC